MNSATTTNSRNSVTPTIGARYAITNNKGIRPSVFELVRVEPKGIYPFVMRLVDFDQRYFKTRAIGEEMTVEAAWFAVRGALPATQQGAVREVSR